MADIPKNWGIIARMGVFIQNFATGLAPSVSTISVMVFDSCLFSGHAW